MEKLQTWVRRCGSGLCGHRMHWEGPGQGGLPTGLPPPSACAVCPPETEHGHGSVRRHASWENTHTQLLQTNQNLLRQTEMHLLRTTVKHLLLTKESCSHSREVYVEKHSEFTRFFLHHYFIYNRDNKMTLRIWWALITMLHIEQGQTSVTLRKRYKKTKTTHCRKGS